MPRRFYGGLRTRLTNKVLEFSTKTFLLEKMNNWLGYLCIAGLALVYAWLITHNDKWGFLLFGIIAGIVIAIICLTQVEFSFYLLLFLSFFIYFISAFVFKGELPVGAIFDTIVVLTFLSLLITRTDFKKSWANFIKIPLVGYILVRFFFDLVEMFNPNSMGASATSFQGVRKFLEYTMILFIAYTLFDSYQRIRKFTVALFIAATGSAIYGCIQQWHGLFDFELQPILANPHAFGLLFQNGEFKKFSTMSDPSSFGIIMAVCATFFLLLGIQEKNKAYRASFFIGSIFMILGMGYSSCSTSINPG